MYQAPPPMMPQRDRRHQLPGRGLVIGIFIGIITALIYGLLWGLGLAIFDSSSQNERILYIIGGIIVSFIIGAIPSGVIGAVTGWLIGLKLSRHPVVPTRKQVFGWAFMLSGTITLVGSIMYLFYIKLLQQKAWEETLITYLFLVGAPSILYNIICPIMSLRLHRWSLQAYQPNNYRPPYSM